MRFQRNDPPRRFSAGATGRPLSHVATVILDPGEVITFRRTESGPDYDFVATAWGYYATASINGRLATAGFDVALVEATASNKQFVLSVERAHLADFRQYLNEQGLRVITWLGSSTTTGGEMLRDGGSAVEP